MIKGVRANKLTAIEVDLAEAVARYFGRASLMAVKLTI